MKLLFVCNILMVLCGIDCHPPKFRNPSDTRVISSDRILTDILQWSQISNRLPQNSSSGTGQNSALYKVNFTVFNIGGLIGASTMSLSLNGTTPMNILSAGTGSVTSVFPLQIPANAGYTVTVASHTNSGNVFCNVPSGSGTISNSDVSVNVYCFGLNYSTTLNMPSTIFSNQGTFFTPTAATGGDVTLNLVLNASPSNALSFSTAAGFLTTSGTLNGVASIGFNISSFVTGFGTVTPSIGSVTFTNMNVTVP